ncbi:putative phage tail protein [Aeromonas schubertii]|uniref:Phage tail protein n=1 Tax=Aeromonas schubertii TaxID=652 RepID=A0A0S2SHX1_9GAMM|nr:putative phage tail protein [Aeromonas schubertii]ALP41297.1 hypothetical protein WL1483_1878 [Aeromonas schubertii]
MAHSVEQWADYLSSQMPRGKAWPTDPDSSIQLYIKGFAPRLAEAEFSADQLLLEMRPETTVQLLTDWEEYLGLPECNVGGNTFDERRAAATEKYHRKGGVQLWSIEETLAFYGITVIVYEHWPHHCLRGCDYPLWPDEYRLTVIIDGSSADANAAQCLLSKLAIGGIQYIVEV